MTNQESLQKYKEYLQARSHTNTYANIVKLWLDYMEAKQITEVTQESITNFFNSENNYAVASRNLFINACRDYYSHFLQVPKEMNEWYKIKLISLPYKIPDFIMESKDITEAKKVLKTYHAHKYTIPKIEALLDFLFTSGCRKSELLSLKRADFDMDNNKAKVLGKGKKDRYVYFDNPTKKELQLYFTTEPETSNAFNITINQINYIARLIGKHLGKKVYPHLFRHSGARHMLMKDIPLPMVSRILGHTNIMTTMRYLDPNEKMISDKYKEKME